MQPIRDVDQIRGFLSGIGPTALFDMPFMPIFFAGCFIIHPWHGLARRCSAASSSSALTLLTEAKSRGPMCDLNRSIARATRDRRHQSPQRGGGAGARHARLPGQAVTTVNTRTSRRPARQQAASGIGVAAKVFRMVLQSSALGLGAYLVIHGEMSGGSMIAASILMSRALAPIEVAVANWKGFISARQGYRRLEHILSVIPAQDPRLSLPAPTSTLMLQDIYIGPPGAQLPIVQGVSFQMQAGQGLGLIGPSASGKSTLARALVGVWPALRGEVRLDVRFPPPTNPPVGGNWVGACCPAHARFSAYMRERPHRAKSEHLFPSKTGSLAGKPKKILCQFAGKNEESRNLWLRNPQTCPRL